MASVARPVSSWRRRAQRPGWISGAALLGYVVLSVLFFGPRLVFHPESTLVGGLYADPQIFVWSFAWWPHALLHGENPFVTREVWAPSGINLAWATSVPALAVAFAPLTLVFGAILAYNAACIVMAALAAWSAFLLCRYLTGVLWPSLVGGYLFGFSSYILGGELDHIHTVAVFLLPLTALLCLRFLADELGSRSFAIKLGLVFALQAYLSTEILFSLTLALVAGLALAFVCVPTVRPRFARLFVPLAGAGALAATLAAPLLYYAFTGVTSRPPPGAEAIVADALNVVVPTEVSVGGWWSGALSAHFPASVVEQGAYLGLPTLLLFGWFAFDHRRSPAGRFLVLAMLLALLASLGSWVTFDGQRLLALPWLHLSYRPLFDDVAPARFAAYTALAAAIIVAIWASSPLRPAWLRIVMPGLAALAVFPNLAWGGWAHSPPVPALFSPDLARACLGREANVLAFPFGTRGDTLLWQVESNFAFRLAGGYIDPTPPPQFSSPRAVQEIAADDLPPKVTVGSLRTFVRLKRVTVIVLAAREEPVWRPLLARLARPQAIGAVLIYRLSRSPSSAATACSKAWLSNPQS